LWNTEKHELIEGIDDIEKKLKNQHQLYKKTFKKLKKYFLPTLTETKKPQCMLWRNQS